MTTFFATLALLLPLTSAATDSFFGVGMALHQEENRTYVEMVLPGSPAEKNGTIKVGDEILSVQSVAGKDNPWVPVTNLRVEDIVGMIRGEEGVQVGLHLVSATGQYEVFIARERIDLK